MKICRISVLGIALLSGACTPEVAQWSPAESPKENRVDRAVYTYVLPYSMNEKGMGTLEKAKLLEFLKNTVPNPSAVRITLEEYGGHSDKRLMDIERELLRYGVPSDLINRNFDHVDEQYGELHHKRTHCAKKGRKKHHHRKHSGSLVHLVVERFVVITPSCANFLEQIGDASQAYSSSNFGCATEANLGMMIADPRDLLRGRERDPYDGTVLAAGVRRYETDNIKPIAEITTTTMQNPVISVGGGNGGGVGGSSGGGGY